MRENYKVLKVRCEVVETVLEQVTVMVMIEYQKWLIYN